MNSIRTQRKEESRTTSNEDDAFPARSEEYQRRRREWKRQQEREREYEELRQKMILDYEKRRAESLKHNSKVAHHNPGRSRSPSQHGRSSASASRFAVTNEKLHRSTSGVMSLLNESEDAQIDVTELQRIKVNIRRNIPVKEATNELERDILNPEEVILQRRKGEGCKPIFEREEITKAASKSSQVEERRTVVAVDCAPLASTSKLRISKTRSPSLSSKRNRSRSPNYTSYRSRYHADSKHDGKIKHRDHSRSDILKKHEEYEERSTETEMKRYMISAKRSHSRERSQRSSRPSMDERSYRDRYRNRSKERSYERRDTYRPREQRDMASHYIEPVPMSMYYGNFPPPRPIVVSPMIPIRGQIPSMNRGRHPALMAPLRPFPPRFVPPDMYRLGHPVPNPSKHMYRGYGSMF